MFSVIKGHKKWFAISGLLMAASVAAVWGFGLHLGIDFRGGTLTEVSFPVQDPTSAEVKDALSEAGFEAVVQAGDEGRMLVRTGPQDKEAHDRLLTALSERFGQAHEEQFTSIGPSTGRELARKAGWQFLMVSLGIVLYIAYAFRHVTRPVTSWRFGWAAIIALLHDLVIMLGVFAALGRVWGVEIDSLFVTAILTVLGFSVHDTIVVFDRLRENLRVRSGQSLGEVIDSSVNQTMVRSLNTTFTVVFVLLALFLFGADSTRYFTMALIVGITAGTYSSIFLASPILYLWHRRDMKRMS